MPMPSTANEFLEITAKSGLLEPQDLEAFVERQRSAGLIMEDPKKLASRLVREGLLTRFQAGQLLQGKWRNFILNGKYTILGPLGSGGMGHVFLCEHKVMRRRVAIKVLPLRYSSPNAIERFRREARAVAQLHHTNIVGGHDIDQSDKLHFLVMEYIDGSTFHAIVKNRGPLDPIRAAHYIRQAALGLQHAHEAGLVHRDVKPSNLILERTGTVKVLDLGLARFFHDQADDLSKQDLEGPVGTTDYMAPEQALNSHQVDIRADIYSLGATFYFLLAGHGPFKDGTPFQKMIRHQFDQPKPIREISPKVPEEMAKIIDRMMAKDPAERFATPLEVAEALTPWTLAPISLPAAEEMPQLAPTSGRMGLLKSAPDLPESLYERGSSSTPSTRHDKELTPSFGSDRPRGQRLDRAEVAQSSPANTSERTETDGVSATESREMVEIGRPSIPGSRFQALGSPGENSSLTALDAPSKTPHRSMILIAGAIGLVIVLTGIVGGVLYKWEESKKNALSSANAVGRTDGDEPLKLLIPAYFYPAGEGLSQWDRILNSSTASRIIAIVNPNSGPGTVPDPNYVKLLDKARQKDVVFIGYVSTKYAMRSLKDVKEDVDRWIRFYPGIQGIFFDEQTSGPEQVNYYAALYDHVHTDKNLSLVVCNPGTVCAEEYVARPTSDIVCLVEATKDIDAFQRPNWANRYPSDRFGGFLCNIASKEAMKRMLQELKDKRIGHGFITDALEPNPWSRLPVYWNDEVQATGLAKDTQ
jgi:serine/threonine protein kinase